MRYQLGAYPAMTLKGAREGALATLAAWHAGRDPAAERRAAHAVVANTAPAGESAAERLEEWQRAKARHWGARHAAEVARIVKSDIPTALGARALRATTRADWVRVVADKRERSPVMASLLYRTISAFLNFAEASGWIDAPLLPRKGMATLAPPPAARERTLTDDELRNIWHGSARLTVRQRAFVRLLLLTGARVSEIADLDMREIDITARRWRLPAARSKNGRGYVLPLGDLAIAEVEAAGANLHGFRGFSKLKRAIDTESGITDWRFHDFRRTCRTTLSKLGIAREVAEASINHIGGRTGLVGTYDRYDFAAEVLDALQKWQDHVADIVQLAGAEVIALRA